MHELKFRAWDGTMMHYPSVFEFGVNGWNDKTSMAFEHNRGMLTTAYIMQYTGAKDMNGIEIYEGDILRCGRHKIHIESLDRFFWMKYDDQMRIDFSRYEIIGNIYENPEMI